jgi:hypothetical protein
MGAPFSRDARHGLIWADLTGWYYLYGASPRANLLHGCHPGQPARTQATLDHGLPVRAIRRWRGAMWR